MFEFCLFDIELEFYLSKENDFIIKTRYWKYVEILKFRICAIDSISAKLNNIKNQIRNLLTLIIKYEKWENVILTNINNQMRNIVYELFSE